MNAFFLYLSLDTLSGSWLKPRVEEEESGATDGLRLLITSLEYWLIHRAIIT
jgi:hypothetical protein